MLSPIRSLQCLNFLRFLSLSLPIFAPLLLARDLSNEQVIYVQSVYAISLVLFELPSGYLSDVLCRKTLLVSGVACLFLANFGFLISTSFIGFVVSEIFYALATSFFSGTDSAYLFEFLTQQKREATYPRQESIMQMTSRGAEAIGGLASGLLAMFALYLPILVWVILLCIGLFIALSLPKLSHQQKAKKHNRQNFLLSLKTFMHGAKAKHSVLLILCSAVLSTIILAYFWLSQIYMVKLGLPYYCFGIVSFFYLLTAAIFSRLYLHLYKYVGQHLLLICSGLAIFGLVIFCELDGIWALAGGFCVQAAFGLKMPLVYNLLNQSSENSFRAFVISLDSVFSRAFFGLAAIFIGGLMSNSGLQQTVFTIMLVASCLLLPLTLAYFFFLSLDSKVY